MKFQDYHSFRLWEMAILNHSLDLNLIHSFPKDILIYQYSNVSQKIFLAYLFFDPRLPTTTK